MTNLENVFRNAMESVKEIDKGNLGTLSTVRNNNGFSVLYLKHEMEKIIINNPLIVNVLDKKAIQYRDETYTNIEFSFAHKNVRYFLLLRSDSESLQEFEKFLTENDILVKELK